jgi:hypothetical protein
MAVNHRREVRMQFDAALFGTEAVVLQGFLQPVLGQGDLPSFNFAGNLDAIAFLANPFDFLSNPHRHCLSAAAGSFHGRLQFFDGEVSQSEDIDAGNIDIGGLFARGGRNAVEVRSGVAVDGVGGSFDSHGVYRVVGHSGCARTFVRE